MSRLNKVIQEVYHLRELALQDKWINQIHPLAKLIVTLSYIVAVISFQKYDLIGLMGMSIYPMITLILGELPIKQSLHQTKGALVLVCIVGMANPFFDHVVLGRVGGLIITGGMLSMLTLMIKGIFVVLASYLLIATTSLESIGYALRLLYLPRGMITIILLINRYMIILLEEVEETMQAYHLRAPKQKGINIKVWGSLVGQLFLKSIDRAQLVYESMVLRGFQGEFITEAKSRNKIKSMIYSGIWLVSILFLRFIPIFEIVGSMFI